LSDQREERSLSGTGDLEVVAALPELITLRERAGYYLTKSELYVTDGYVAWRAGFKSSQATPASIHIVPVPN
jgi:hypothetical protein